MEKPWDSGSTGRKRVNPSVAVLQKQQFLLYNPSDVTAGPLLALPVPSSCRPSAAGQGEFGQPKFLWAQGLSVRVCCRSQFKSSRVLGAVHCPGYQNHNLYHNYFMDVGRERFCLEEFTT